jgi:dihydrofolate reductase
MRKVVLGLGISLDGYIARPDGAVDFLSLPKKHSGPPGESYSMRPFFAAVDEAIMGRKTYEMGLKLGGGSLPQSNLKEDLLDELHIGVAPVLIGEGIPLFPSGFPQREFALLENKTYSKGLSALRYERLRGNGKRRAKLKPSAARE